MRKWKRVETAGGPRFRSSLAAHEAALLTNLVSAMIGLLDERESSSPSDELDTSDSLNAALRSLHEPQIISAKRVAAQRLLDTVPDGGGRLELSEEDASAWVAAVNDLRLTLGVMLEVGPEGPDRLPADHPLAAHFDVYQWLTVLQEYLVLGLMGTR